MKVRNVIFFLVVFLSFTACKDESISLGDVEYYPSFWWKDSNITPVVKTFDFEFSEDAKNDNGVFAEFQFVDNDGKPISTDVMQVFMDGEQIPNNIFKVDNSMSSKELTFQFSPDAEEGKHQGYLRLINHELDRIDSQSLSDGQQADVFQWTLNYEKCMNPLKKIVMLIVSGIIALILIWYFCIKPIRYPRFGSIQKTFNVPGMAPLIIKFKGARMVVLASSLQKKQSKWNRFWTGKILYKTHPAFVAPIIFKPSKGRRVLAKVQTGTYQVMPNPVPGIGSATIIDIKKNLKINVN